MSLPAASFEPVISYLNLASPGAEIRSGKTGNSASLRQSGHTTSCVRHLMFHIGLTDTTTTTMLWY